MFLKVKSLPWNSVFYGQKYECMWDIENHSKSYIYFESRILIKMYHDNHNKIEETAGKQNSQNKCDMQKEKKWWTCQFSKILILKCLSILD